MNEVWSAVVYAIIVAIMAETLPIVYIVAQLWEVLNRLEVMGFQVFMVIAKLASKAVTFKHGLFPGKVIGAAPALRVPTVAAFGYALTFNAAISVAVNQFRVWAAKLIPANFASAKGGIGESATAARTVYTPTNMGRRSFKFLAAMFTGDNYLLGSGFGRAVTRAVSLFSVLCPTAIGFFGDNRSALFTRFQFIHHAPIIARI